MRTVTWDQVRTRRLARSHLVAPAPRERLVEVVGDVCGVQAVSGRAGGWARERLASRGAAAS